MRVWDQVYKVDHIKFTANDGQEEATIYGNRRNCVSLTVYFNGYDLDGEVVDLSNEVLTNNDVKLINQGTGEELLQGFSDRPANGIIYTSSASKFFLNSLDGPSVLASISGDMEKRAKVTYFIYGEARAEIVRTIGARFVFYDSKKLKPYDTTQDNRTSQFVRIRVLPEIKYGMSDIEPVKWVETARESDYGVQWDMYIKLTDKHAPNKWYDSQYENISTLNNDKNIPGIMFAHQDNQTYGYYYFFWPIGGEGQYELKNGGDNSHWMNVRFNKVNGAFNITLVRGWKADTNIKPDAIIRLYDIYGNEGKFRLDWVNYLGDHTGPSITSAN